MPYFKNEIVNILFIHIPKTGGTSVEKYFSEKFNIELNNSALYDFLNLEIKEQNKIEINSSLQHMTHNTIMKYKDFFNINYENLEIITIVRNPYYRVLSDLFFLKKIDKYTSKLHVYNVMQKYITTLWDNHGLPQYLFLVDENNELIQNIKIMGTESLQSDMIQLGYTDFDIKTNCNENNINYNDYLNTDSINLINKYYERDFELFGYTKIQNI
jgi:hypothetical protein